jgi:hypothetical protein
VEGKNYKCPQSATSECVMLLLKRLEAERAERKAQREVLEKAGDVDETVVKRKEKSVTMGQTKRTEWRRG